MRKSFPPSPSANFAESAGSALLDAINRNKVHLAKFILDAIDEDLAAVVNFRDFKGKSPLIRSVYLPVSTSIFLPGNCHSQEKSRPRNRTS